MRKILWLVSWYPNKISPFSGDFIQRQAIAAAKFHSIDLVFVTKDLPPVQSLSHPVPLRAPAGSDIREQIFYYPSFPGRGLRSRLHSAQQYIKMHLALIRTLKKNAELPAVVHVQVAMKAGLIALYLKKRYGIPFVISEHWTGYSDESPDALKNKGVLFRFFIKKIFEQASVFLPVTHQLGDLVNSTITRIPTRVIPNVVDTSKFNTATVHPPERFRFIHVSSLLAQKNPAGILAAFEKLVESGFDAELVMVGPADAFLRNAMERKEHLKSRLFFTGEISYEQVALQMKAASALVLFSRVENLPCVILESLCCGLPVISTRVGGIAEVVQTENGILIDPGNETQLLEAMKQMITGYSAYDKNEISRKAQALYNYDAVGKQFAEVYEAILNQSAKPS